MRSASLGLAAWLLALASATAGCDSYDCSNKSCADGKAYQICVSCSSACTGCDGTCSYQTRDSDDEEIATCDYDSPAVSTDNSARDACLAEVEAAACGG